MAQVKTIKKKFFEVKIPLTATKAHVYAHAPEALENSVIKIDLTKNLRGKALELRARIKHENGELTGIPISLELFGSYLRKSIRKGTDYVEDSFQAECKDATLRIKPFMLTRKHVSRAVRRELRNLSRKHLEVCMKVRTVDEIMSEITTNKIQKELAQKLKKIYPLALCEIRTLEVISRKA